MANYRVGDYIRLRRMHSNMNQEELAFRAGIATETISRIENGRHKITIGVYKKIMSVFDDFPQQFYGICMAKDVKVIEERQIEEDAESKFEYEKARKYLSEIKDNADENKVNEQYIMRAEAVLDFGLKKINEQEMLVKLETAIALTVENYKEIVEHHNEMKESYPFTEQEILILLNIADAYGRIGNYDYDEKIKRVLLQCIEREYIDGNNVKNLKLVVKCNLAYTMMLQKRYLDALELLEGSLEVAKKEGNGLVIPAILLDMAWVMKKINNTSDDVVYEERYIKKILRQAYYFAAARNDNYIKEIAEKILINEYKDLFSVL